MVIVKPNKDTTVTCVAKGSACTVPNTITIISAKKISFYRCFYFLFFQVQLNQH